MTPAEFAAWFAAGSAIGILLGLLVALVTGTVIAITELGVLLGWWKERPRTKSAGPR